MSEISLMVQHTITSITRESYTGDKSTYATVASNVRGYIRPLTEQQASVNGFQYGQGYMALFPDAVDVREGDKVTWDGVTYLVKGVARHNRGSFPFKRCVMELPQTS